MAATGYKTDPRAVTSVEGRTGVVDVTFEDVGGQQAVDDAVEGALGTQVSDAITVHEGDTDPHGDRAYADGAISTAAASLVPASRTITAGTGLTGGGDLSANRSLAVSYGSSAGTAAQGNDSRLSDARTPTAHVHAASDTTSGTFDIARIPTGTSGSTAALGNHTHGVATGGTGLTSVTANSYLKGNGTGSLVERTYAQVRTDLGFDTAWTPPNSFATNMTNAGNPWYDVGAWVDPSGFHHWRGRVNAGANYTANATIFTLESAVRPTRDVEVAVRFVGVGAANGVMKITASTGAVSFSASITVGAASAWVLDGVRFWGGAN